MNPNQYLLLKKPRWASLLICCLLIGGLTGCNAFKVVRIPIPIPTLGLIGNKDKVAKAPASSKGIESVPGKVYYGKASWYGKKFHRRQTANGERYNMYEFTAAHRELPFNTKVRVTNLDNGESCVVRINDRGPFIEGRIIDVSLATARKLDFEHKGITDVKIEVL